MTDDELLKALRDTVQAQNKAFQGKEPDLPLNDAAFLERMTDFSLGQLAVTPLKAKAQAPKAQPRSEARLFRKTAWVWPLAAAAAILLVLLPGEPEVPLAQYRVEVVQGTQQTTRDVQSAEVKSLMLIPDLPFELTLRPASQTPGPLTAKVHLSQAGLLSAVPVSVDVTALGVVHVRGKLPTSLDLTAPESLLLVTVGRPDALPELSDLNSHREMRPSPSFQSFRIEIRARQP